jgi:signal transduction histidine kinase
MSWRRIGDGLIIGLAVVMDLTTWAGEREVLGGPMVPLLVIPIVTIAVYSTLLLRWRHPVGVFGGQLAFALITLVVPEFQPFAGLLLALHAMAARRPARWSLAALASTLVPFGIHSEATTKPIPDGSVTAFLQVLVLWMLLATAAWGVGRLSYVGAQRAWRLRELQAAAASAAVQAERMHLARELHDIVAHTVTIMMIQAAGAKAVLEPGHEKVRNALEVIENSGVQAMSELHRLLNLLRMTEPDQASSTIDVQPTVADIEHLVTAAVQAGRDVSLTEEGVPGPLDPSVEAAAYRVVQESLTNALKHGGPSASVMVRLRWSELILELEVTDQVREPNPIMDRAAALSSGHGLRGLRERVTMVGGSLDFGPEQDGFAVRARLPRPKLRVSPLLGTGRAR